MLRYVAVDLEMTGLQVKTDSILEIGAALVEGGKVVDTYQCFVQPRMGIPERVQELTGITPEMLVDALTPEEAITQFLEFAGEETLLGHNLIFDYSFLKQAAVNAGYQFERMGIDTLKIARKVLPDEEKKTLEALCDRFGIVRDQKHRALDDALAAAMLYEELRKTSGEENVDSFAPKPLQFKIKKQGMLTPAQKRDLNRLFICHRIEWNIDIDKLTRSEASRLIDKIYTQYGRLPKREESKNEEK